MNLCIFKKKISPIQSNGLSFPDLLFTLFLDSVSHFSLAMIIPFMQSCWHCIEGLNINSSAIKTKIKQQRLLDAI